MHNEFYVSGFIYHPASEKILLHQHQSSTEEPVQWHMFGGESTEGETPRETFHRIVSEQLGLPIKLTDCYFVYDYPHKEKKIPTYIHYAILEKLPEEELLEDSATTGWFAFKQIAKLPIKKQSKQDIIVGQRVINLAVRELEVTEVTP